MGLFHNKMTRNSVWQTGIIFFNVQVSYKSYQMCFRHFTFSLSWTPMFRHEWGFMWGSYSGDHTPFPWGKCKWGNPCILAIPNKIIHNCVCVYSSWKQRLDHNQRFLVWCTLLSDKVEQRYSGPLELRPSAFFCESGRNLAIPSTCPFFQMITAIYFEWLVKAWFWTLCLYRYMCDRFVRFFILAHRTVAETHVKFSKHKLL